LDVGHDYDAVAAAVAAAAARGRRESLEMLRAIVNGRADEGARMQRLLSVTFLPYGEKKSQSEVFPMT
jgi:hypothetical protein